MSRSQELTPKPSLSLTSTSRHRGTLLSHETRKVACSNPYLIQPFHIWIISQARDDFPGYKDWLLLSATQASPDQCCRGLRGRSTAPASFPLSQEVTLFFFFFFSSHFSFSDRETASLPRSKMRMSLQSHRWALNVFRQYSDLSWPQGSRVPSQQGLFSSTLLRGAGIMQHSPQSWTSEHYLKYRKTQCLLQIPQRLGLLACWNWWKYQVHITDRGLDGDLKKIQFGQLSCSAFTL